MNIGFICGEYPPCTNGGIGTFTKDLAEGLAKKGHRIIVFGIYYNSILKLDKRKDEVINNIEVIRLPFNKYTGNSYVDDLLNRVFLFRFAQKLISIKSLDIIEAYDSTGLMPFKLCVPFITRLHGTVTYFGMELGRPFSRFISFFEKRQIQKSDLIIGVSKYVLDQSLKYFSLKNRGIVIYNSVNIDASENTVNNTENDYILYFGSILPKKGVEQLIKSMKIVFERIPNISLVMIGKSFIMKDGIEYPNYLLRLLPYDFQTSVKVIKHVDKKDLFSYINNSYCCVFPSFTECFALAPMEAMAIGKPVIYSTLHSGPELIKDGFDGLLVNPGNVEEIAEKIIYLIENPVIAEKIGKNGQNTITTRFNYDKWLEENEEMYKSLIKIKPSAE